MSFDRMLSYTKSLSENNNRVWFHDNHKEYEEARDDFLALADIIKLEIAQYAPAIGDSLLFENSKNFMYRIPRDMRYSKDKLPYNPAFRAYFSPKKKNYLPLSYYLHVSHERCFLEGGAYPWEPKDLNRLREHIYYNYEELESIIAENDLEVYGQKLKRVPRGFDSDHPAAEWMKYKFYLTEYKFTTEDMRNFNSFADAAGIAIERFEPLRLFLSAAYEIEPEDFDEY